MPNYEKLQIFAFKEPENLYIRGIWSNQFRLQTTLYLGLHYSKPHYSRTPYIKYVSRNLATLSENVPRGLHDFYIMASWREHGRLIPSFWPNTV